MGVCDKTLSVAADAPSTASTTCETFVSAFLLSSLVTVPWPSKGSAFSVLSGSVARCNSSGKCSALKEGTGLACLKNRRSTVSTPLAGGANSSREDYRRDDSAQNCACRPIATRPYGRNSTCTRSPLPCYCFCQAAIREFCTSYRGLVHLKQGITKNPARAGIRRVCSRTYNGKVHLLA